MKKGLVIGKFYPPHKGHKYLIETAKAQCDELTVIVCHHESQVISGELRARWIKEMVKGIKTLVVPDTLPADDSKAWAEYTIKALGFRPDVVFTSEDYGPVYASFLKCEHVMVDRERETVPISATKARSDVKKYWDYLEPCVRSYFIKKIVIVGAESTGTTTLAKDLAEHFKEPWVPEFGRLYSEAIWNLPEDKRWVAEDFKNIARTQSELAERFSQKAKEFLILDTDAFATSIWQERYLGFVSPEVEKIINDTSYDIYILTGDEIPFVQDGLRDGEYLRHAMHKRFEEKLQSSGKKYYVLRGGRAERLKQAIEICNVVQKSIF